MGLRPGAVTVHGPAGVQDHQGVGNTPGATRRKFITTLRRELPDALRKLQQGNIAPVDLAQAACPATSTPS